MTRPDFFWIWVSVSKTVITLTALESLLHDSFEAERVLVIAPLRVAQSTWAQEAEKWPHLKDLSFALALGSRKERIAALEQHAEITLINRENVQWLVEHYGKRWPFDTVVIDELSSFRNPGAKRFRALRKVRPYMKRVIGLTGTPTPKGVIDLWAQIYLLDKGERLGRTVTAYRHKWFQAGAHKGDVVFEWMPRPGATDEILGRLSDICVSMRAADHLDLPACSRIVHKVTLPPYAMAKYRQFERDMCTELNGTEITAFSAGAVSIKLRQFADGDIYADGEFSEHVHDAKLDALEDLIEAANGSPVLVYYGFRHSLKSIKTRFPEAVEIGGPDTIEAWNAGQIPILLAHPASAGHGLNLQQGGSVIIWYGLMTDLELYQQANARIMRQGQEKPVRIYHLTANDTHDEDCLPVLEGRAVTQEYLLNALRARGKEKS